MSDRRSGRTPAEGKVSSLMVLRLRGRKPGLKKQSQTEGLSPQGKDGGGIETRN